VQTPFLLHSRNLYIEKVKLIYIESDLDSKHSYSNTNFYGFLIC